MKPFQILVLAFFIVTSSFGPGVAESELGRLLGRLGGAIINETFNQEEIRRAKQSEASFDLQIKKQVQFSLNYQGFNVGSVDGVFGTNTRNGIARFQKSINQSPTGYLTNQQANFLFARTPKYVEPKINPPETQIAHESPTRKPSTGKNTDEKLSAIAFLALQKADRLKLESKSENQQKTEKKHGPVILTVDGVDPLMLQLKGVTGLFAEGRGESYLLPKIKEHWSFAQEFQYAPWSGDYKDTDKFLTSLKQLISLLAQLSERHKEPFVIVTHSWGSVLAYRAISENVQEGKLKEGAIDVFVTLGSPMGARRLSILSNWNAPDGLALGFVAKKIADKNANWAGAEAVLGPVVMWRNYWIDEDKISGPIDGLDNNNVELDFEPTSDNCSLDGPFSDIKVPHSAYYTECANGDGDVHLTRIGIDVLQALEQLPENSVDNEITGKNTTKTNKHISDDKGITQIIEKPKTEDTSNPINKSSEPSPSKWLFAEENDDIFGLLGITAWTPSVEFDKATLNLQCRDKDYSVYFKFNGEVISTTGGIVNNIPIRMKVDDEEVLDSEFSLSTTGTAVFFKGFILGIPRGNPTQAGFTRSIAQHKKFSLLVRGNRNFKAVFDLSGIKPAASRILEACGLAQIPY